ncbi:UxaA family hydrolase [Shouchella shacheensis]|uniref:UxaA family hydrolase n=1 Tax=Shouchella shacheensis TaxID=1649580 RepID=UPI00073FC9A9|nr:altronate dehydratase family protein [Shouchella shacheensis]
MTSPIQLVHEHDSIVVSLKPLKKGETFRVKETEITLLTDVPQGNKIAIQPIQPGEDIIKYGFPIGHATEKIETGTWVHSQNVKTNLSGNLSYEFSNAIPMKIKLANSSQTFSGYVRKNGDVGIRNEIWILNTVGCINKVAEHLAKLGNTTFQGEDIDGVFHFPHPFGCSQLGDDLTYTQKILARLASHQNAAGVLVLGLGCENNYIDSFKKVIPNLDTERIRFLSVQEVEDEMDEGLALMEELVEYARQFQRESVPIAKLKVGLKCGGSDGFSGITANPLVGAFSDLLVEQGGTTIMTEVPEMFGAETILMDRASDEGVFNEIVTLINDFKDYFVRYDQPVYENPSPGNKDGGITTLEEKSLGCVQKGGFSPVVDVVPYGHPVEKNGFNLVQGPGNDLVSVTALAAAGAHIVLFTTGRGTPFGGPVPTMKIATNSQLFRKKGHWMDFNAGQLVEGRSMEQVKHELFNAVIAVASGETEAKNETYDFKEMAIFKDGVIL